MKRIASACALLGLSACAGPSQPPGTARETAARPLAGSDDCPLSNDSPSPHSVLELVPGVTPSTTVTSREEQTAAALTTRSELEVRWREVDASGRGSLGTLEILVDRSVREGREIPTDLEGLVFDVRAEGTRLRLLEGEAPHQRDVTHRYPSLATRLLALSGRSHLLPTGRTSIGTTWSVPLRQFLDATHLPLPGRVGGTVDATLVHVSEDRACIRYEVVLETLAGGGSPMAVTFSGHTVFDRESALPVRSQSKGTIRQGAGRVGFEVKTQGTVTSTAP